MCSGYWLMIRDLEDVEKKPKGFQIKELKCKVEPVNLQHLQKV